MSDVVVLPKIKSAALHKSPKNLVIFSKPKTGKTSLVAELPDCLILDLEGGTDYIEAMKLSVTSIEDIKNIGSKIKEEKFPYKYLVVDTITALEEMCIPYGELLYSKTAQGKNWFKFNEDKVTYHPESGKATYGSILNLPNGSGYQYLREAFIKVIEYIKTLAPRVIFLGHVRDIYLEKAGAEFSSLDLDLTGKIKRIMMSQSDAIGYLYRKGKKNMLSFITNDQVSCGARPSHLRNEEFVISEMKDGVLVADWSKIYID